MNGRINRGANAHRIQKSLLSALEKRVLQWFAKHMPERISSDHLTLLAISSMALAGLAYALSHYTLLWLHAVNILLVLHWFGDSMDGTLARYRGCERPRYGYYVDHMMDSFALLFVLGGLAISPLMSERVAFGLLVAYLLLSINAYLAAQTRGEFRISFLKLSPTELRLLLIAGNLTAISRPQIELVGRNFLFFDVSGVIATACMVVMLLVLTTRNTLLLYRLERL